MLAAVKFSLKNPLPATLNNAKGLVVPMPTLPLPLMTNLSVVPRAVEEAIENLPLDTSYPIVHAPAVAPPENSNADLVAEYILKRLFGVVVPMPTLPPVILIRSVDPS